MPGEGRRQAKGQTWTVPSTSSLGYLTTAWSFSTGLREERQWRQAREGGNPRRDRLAVLNRLGAGGCSLSFLVNDEKESGLIWFSQRRIKKNKERVFVLPA